MAHGRTVGECVRSEGTVDTRGDVTGDVCEVVRDESAVCQYYNIIIYLLCDCAACDERIFNLSNTL